MITFSCFFVLCTSQLIQVWRLIRSTPTTPQTDALRGMSNTAYAAAFINAAVLSHSRSSSMS